MDRSRSEPNGKDPPALPIYRIVSVSTANITKTDDKLLAEDLQADRPWMLGGSPFGYVLFVPDGAADLMATLGEMKGRGYSDAFMAIVNGAYLQQARFLRFDAEEYVAADWPTFEW